MLRVTATALNTDGSRTLVDAFIWTRIIKASQDESVEMTLKSVLSQVSPSLCGAQNSLEIHGRVNDRAGV